MLNPEVAPEGEALRVLGVVTRRREAGLLAT